MGEQGKGKSDTIKQIALPETLKLPLDY